MLLLVSCKSVSTVGLSQMTRDSRSTWDLRASFFFFVNSASTACSITMEAEATHCINHSNPPLANTTKINV